jgi:hypothetical protein
MADQPDTPVDQSAAFEPLDASRQFPARSLPGWVGLAIVVVLLAIALALFGFGEEASIAGVAVALLGVGVASGLVVV